MKFSSLIPALSVFSLMISSCDKTGEIDLDKTDKSISLVNDNHVDSSFKVAFVGDSGYHKNFINVLNLIKNEHVDLVIHLGDMAYHEDKDTAPASWNSRIDEVLGEKFPYLFLIGNHDVGRWHQETPMGYAAILKKRLASNPDIICKGEAGVKSYCTYKGLFFILSGVGTYGTRHEDFIGHALRQSSAYKWRVCAWHKNQKDMQAGTKTDSIGWEAYKLCQSFGAMIATGHEHSYARTKNLNNVGNRKNNHGAFGNSQELELGENKTFAFVSGLGGHSLRPFSCHKKAHEWWASVFTNNYILENGEVKHNECGINNSDSVNFEGVVPYNYGALFITFNADGEASKMAKAEFKTVDGHVVDQFTIHSQF